MSCLQFHVLAFATLSVLCGASNATAAEQADDASDWVVPVWAASPPQPVPAHVTWRSDGMVAWTRQLPGEKPQRGQSREASIDQVGAIVVTDLATGRVRSHKPFADPDGTFTDFLFGDGKPHPSYQTAMPAKGADLASDLFRVGLVRMSVERPDGRLVHLLHVRSERRANPLIDTTNADPKALAEIENDLTYEVEKLTWPEDPSSIYAPKASDYEPSDQRLDSLLVFTGPADNPTIEAVRGFGTDRVIRAIAMTEDGSLQIVWNDHDRRTTWLGPAWQRVHVSKGLYRKRQSPTPPPRPIGFGASIIALDTLEETEDWAWTEPDVEQVSQRGDSTQIEEPVTRIVDGTVLLSLRTDIELRYPLDRRRRVIARKLSETVPLVTTFLDRPRVDLDYDVVNDSVLVADDDSRIVLYPFHEIPLPDDAGYDTLAESDIASHCIATIPPGDTIAARTPDDEAIVAVSGRFTADRDSSTASEVRLYLIERPAEASWDAASSGREPFTCRSDVMHQTSLTRGVAVDAARELFSLFSAPKPRSHASVSDRHGSVHFVDQGAAFVTNAILYQHADQSKRHDFLYRFDMDTLRQLPDQHGHVHSMLPVDVTFDCEHD